MITNEQLRKLADLEPVEPRGWFRWLHNHYLGRSGVIHAALTFGDLYKDEWRELSDKPRPLHETIDDPELMIAFLNRHAWMAGMCLLIQTVGTYWLQMDSTARGNFFAGISERDTSDKMFERAIRNIPKMDFTPESLCQLACNAIKNDRIDLLTLLLPSKVDLTANIRRFEGFKSSFDENEELEQVSHRVIDMILEAALIRNNPDAVRLALEHGADPNIPLWQLERSFNEKHSGLSYAISEDQRELAEILLQHGASPSGISFAGQNQELFLAISRGWDDHAEQLIANGAQLSSPATDAYKKVQKFFGHSKEEIDWAHTIIGSLIPLLSVEDKQVFYCGDGQGGQYETILSKVVGNLKRLKRYEALGLDTRLTAEEFCSAIYWKTSAGLDYLLSKHGEDVRDKVFAAIRERKPEFGTGRSA